jgi:hypothetical protein
MMFFLFFLTAATSKNQALLSLWTFDLIQINSKPNSIMDPSKWQQQQQLLLPHRYVDGLGEIDDWELLDDGDFKGVLLAAEKKNGKIVYMSTKHCSAADMWNIMPSLAEFPSLVVLDLHKCRYITELHESVGDLADLKQLLLTRCSILRTLPPTIGKLQHLTEVRYIKDPLVCGVERF